MRAGNKEENPNWNKVRNKKNWACLIKKKVIERFQQQNESCKIQRILGLGNKVEKLDHLTKENYFF